MAFLGLDGIALGRRSSVGTHGEDAGVALPGEVREVRYGRSDWRRPGFELFDEFGDGGDGAGESDGEMDAVRNTADEEAFPVEVACNGGEVGVEVWGDGGSGMGCGPWWRI